MSYLEPIRSSVAYSLINQYNTAINKLQTDPKTKDCQWVNSVISEYKNYIAQLNKNSVPDNEFEKISHNKDNQQSSLYLIVWFRGKYVPI